MRIDTLTFEHHQIAASLPDHQATDMLQWCAEDPKQPRTAQQLRTRIQQLRRASRDGDLAGKSDAWDVS
jgi:hypothetical protein